MRRRSSIFAVIAAGCLLLAVYVNSHPELLQLMARYALEIRKLW